MEFRLSESQQQLKEMIHGFAHSVLRPMSLEADRAHRLPDDFLAKLGMMARAFPGGGAAGLTANDDAPVAKRSSSQHRTTLVASEEMAWGDAAVILSIPGPGLGGPPVRFMGTPEQKERYFAVFKQPGVHFGAYGLTEPGAGSDVAGIATTCRKDGDHWVLDGRKCYITNGARADWVVIFATVDRALGRAGHRAFVVEKGTPGFSVGKIEDKMGLRASETAELVLEGCRVHERHLLGGEEHYRGSEGFMGAMKTFDATRPVVGVMAVGIARAAHEVMVDFVKQNYLLSRPIPRYGALAAKIAEGARLLDAARLMCWRAAWMADEGIPNAKEASMAKAYAARAAMKVASDAMDVMGAHGLEESHLVEKWYRDLKVFDIFEGTAQIQRIVIARRLLK
jgi:acyl-CoA dehydrogenase